MLARMKVNGYLARQFAQPSGLVGRYLVAPWLDRSNRQVSDTVFNALKLESHWRVAEIGFGGGDLLRRIADSLDSGTVVGIDPSRDVIERLRDRIKGSSVSGRVDLCLGTADQLPLPDEDLNLAISVNTIYFWEALDHSLAELHRVLRPGGRLVLGFSDGQNHEAKGYLEYGYRTPQLRDVVEQSRATGFKEIEHDDIERGARGIYHVVKSRRP